MSMSQELTKKTISTALDKLLFANDLEKTEKRNGKNKPPDIDSIYDYLSRRKPLKLTKFLSSKYRMNWLRRMF